MKKIDVINDIYEVLNDHIRQEMITHSEVVSMFKDFLQDTLDIGIELDLNQKQLQDLDECIECLTKVEKIKLGSEGE